MVLAGRPNVGKSTFLNAAVGGKVAIVSEKPQTTRRAIRGVRTDPRTETQIVFVDLPGIQRPRDPLTERMAGRVTAELRGSDAGLLILDAVQGVGPGDRFTATALAEAGLPIAIAVNKIDRLPKAGVAAALLAATALSPDSEVFPISARTGEGLPALLAHLATVIPEGPYLYEPGERSDQPQALLLAELIREAAIRRTFSELPHAVEAVVEDITRPREDLTRLAASIWVETSSQKRIVVGAGGRMIKAIGIAARKSIEAELESRVHLELTVRVRRAWRSDEALLDRLGIE